MNDKTTPWLMIGLLGVILIISLFPLGLKNIIVSNNAIPKITVSGEAQQEVMPDKAVLTLTVLTEGRDAQQVQNDNSAKMNAVMVALKSSGVEEKDIETSGYSLYPWQEYDYNLQKTVDKGYRLQNTITVTTTDLSKVGGLLDLAVKSGINTVDNVAFKLSDAKEKQIKEALISDASTKARAKAEALADSMHVSVGDLLFVSESSYTPGVYYAEYKTLTMDAGPSTQINPKSVQVSVTVNADFGID